jgi:hypothetical protein
MDLLTLGLMGAGAVGKYLNKPKDIDYDFNYDVDTASYDPSSGLMGSIGDLRGASKTAMGAGNEFMGAYRQMLNPGSSYYQGMFGELRRSSSDMAAQLNTNMNKALASRGVGKGGMSSLLSSANAAQVGEDLRKGFRGIQETGLGYASQFGGLANTAFGNAIQGYGQVGGLESGIDDRRLRTELYNTGAMNERNRYMNNMGYNQMVGNANARAAWGDSMSSSLFDMAGMAMPNFRFGGPGLSGQDVMNLGNPPNYTG